MVKFPTPLEQVMVKCPGFARGDVEVSNSFTQKKHLHCRLAFECFSIIFFSTGMVLSFLSTHTYIMSRERMWSITFQCISTWCTWLRVLDGQLSSVWLPSYPSLFWPLYLVSCIIMTFLSAALCKHLHLLPSTKFAHHRWDSDKQISNMGSWEEISQKFCKPLNSSGVCITVLNFLNTLPCL